MCACVGTDASNGISFSATFLKAKEEPWKQNLHKRINSGFSAGFFSPICKLNVKEKYIR